MSAGARSFEVEGVKFFLLEGFKELYKVLSMQEESARWDVLALDQYMTAEIVSLGNMVKLAMYAEVETESIPQQIPHSDDIELEINDGKVTLKSYIEYKIMSKATTIAIVKKINEFRRVLASIISQQR